MQGNYGNNRTIIQVMEISLWKIALREHQDNKVQWCLLKKKKIGHSQIQSFDSYK